MFYVMVAALVILFAGVFIPDQWAREHAWLFIGYWLVCLWLTVTGILLAMFDILMVRAATRIRRRQIEAELLGKDGNPTGKE